MDKDCKGCNQIVPCSDFYRSCSVCRPCLRRRQVQAYVFNRTTILARNAKWSKENVDVANRCKSRWTKNNPNESRAASRKHAMQAYAANPEFFKHKSRMTKMSLRGYYSMKQRERNLQVKRATPSWVDRSSLRYIYDNRPSGHHVDHIVPINNPFVCGLHVPWNLQYLIAADNLRKHNSADGLPKGHGC